MLPDEIDQLEHFRQQLAVLLDGNPPRILPHLGIVFRILRGEPDNSSPSAFDRNHPLHGFQVDAAIGEVHRYAAENFQSRNFLAHHVCQRGGGFEMVFQYQSAHAGFFRQPRQIIGVDRARSGVRAAVDVEIDRALQI